MSPPLRSICSPREALPRPRRRAWAPRRWSPWFCGTTAPRRWRPRSAHALRFRQSLCRAAAANGWRRSDRHAQRHRRRCRGAHVLSAARYPESGSAPRRRKRSFGREPRRRDHARARLLAAMRNACALPAAAARRTRGNAGRLRFHHRARARAREERASLRRFGAGRIRDDRPSRPHCLRLSRSTARPAIPTPRSYAPSTGSSSLLTHVRRSDAFAGSSDAPLGAYAAGEFADVFCERRKTVAYRLQDGRIHDATYGVTLGVGIRVVAGESAGYAYSDDLSLDALLRGCRRGVADRAHRAGRRGSRRAAARRKRRLLLRRRTRGSQRRVALYCAARTQPTSQRARYDPHVVAVNAHRNRRSCKKFGSRPARAVFVADRRPHDHARHSSRGER